MKIKKTAILGCTGSIGSRALEIAVNNPNEFQIIFLAAEGSDFQVLLKQCAIAKPKYLLISNPEKADHIKNHLDQSITKVVSGEEGYKKIVNECEFDITMHAISGMAGIIPAFEMGKISKTVAIVNKESIICGGQILLNHLHNHNSNLIPVDSEHNSLYQLLQNEKVEDIEKIIITGSGGPLYNYHGSLEDVTPAIALNHPKWNMGRKNTIDSATLVNKGLELIEAAVLFNIDIDRIECIIQPQVIIHALLQMKDSSMRAYLSRPDMKLHIAHAMYGRIVDNIGIEKVDLLSLGNLDFKPIDHKNFPAVNLAREAYKKGLGAVIAYNTADEILVKAFLQNRIKLTTINNLLTRLIEDEDYNIPNDTATIIELINTITVKVEKMIATSCC